MHEKVVSHLEEEVKKATTEMNGMKFKTNIASSLAFFVLYRYVSSSYSGTVVARLPFLPFKMLSNFTHRGIDGDDLHDCGFGLIYSLATMAVKQNVPKLLGFTAPRSAFDPSKAAARAAAKLEADS
jgi:calcium load-activated calcium channel